MSLSGEFCLKDKWLEHIYYLTPVGKNEYKLKDGRRISLGAVTAKQVQKINLIIELNKLEEHGLCLINTQKLNLQMRRAVL